MAVFKCKMCGGQLEIEDETSICSCEFCGTKQTIPTIRDENVQGLFNRANVLRMKAEFDRSAELYEKILAIESNESEAYWGLVLCKYGIEYVEDPSTYKRIPTCHRTSFEPITADDDYKKALEYANVLQKSIYELEAETISKIQKGIIEVAQNEEPYDVFICYKESDENGKRTKDSVIANDIYHQLTQEGYRVFYAVISLEDKLGQEYEPFIFAALNSARVMLSIGTRPEYFNAVWVKNEWSRYMKLMKNDHSRLLIPCYRDMDAYELPEEFAHLQAQDMSKIGFINDIVRGIKKVIIKKDSANNNGTNVTNVQQIVTQVNANAIALVQRGNMALEDEDWDKADSFFEEALNNDAQNADAYVGKMLTYMRLHSKKELKNAKKSFENDGNLKKALRFGTDELVEELNGYIDYIKNQNMQKIYDDALIAIEYDNYAEAKKLFLSIVNYSDAKNRAEECDRREKELKEIKAAEEARDEETIIKIVNAVKYKHSEIDKVRQQLANLSKERNSLGILAGKRKKEIDEEMKSLSVSLEKTVNDIDMVVDGEGTRYCEVINELNNEIILKKYIDKYPDSYFMYKNANISLGEKVSFGKYEGEDLVWKILDIQDNKLLLLSDKVIDAIPYSRPGEAIWDRCYMKTWLNKIFYNNSFGNEKKIICPTCLNKESGLADRVFILNSVETIKYLKSDSDRICFPTSHAMKKMNMSSLDACAWWLRVSDKNVYADAITNNGRLYRNTEKVEAYANWGVRPAMWIEIKD